MTVFTENIKGQAKEDILNATLFAQLVANEKHDCEQNVLDWYREYRSVLQMLGFVIEGFEFDVYQSSGSSLTMDEAVLEIIGSSATGNDLSVLKAALDTMSKLSNDHENIVLFDTHGCHNSCGNFQILLCSQAPDGNVSLTLGAFYFKGTEKGNNFLFFNRSSSSTQLYKAILKVVLNPNVYAAVRSAVIDRINDEAHRLINSVLL